MKQKDPAGRFLYIIGAQRSGTTWLYHMLDEHPGITMAKPVRPEPKFFLDPASISQGRDAYLARYFADVPADQLKGEKGTSYIEHPEAARPMLDFFPEAMAIAILRHPISRAVSNYRFSLKHGLETREPEAALFGEVPPPPLHAQVSVSPFNYLGRSEYSTQLQPWMDAFGPRLRILVFEEVSRDMAQLAKLYEWLEVDDSFAPPSYAKAVNRTEEKDRISIGHHVITRLQDRLRPQVRDMERLLGRKIPVWHDPI